MFSITAETTKVRNSQWNERNRPTQDRHQDVNLLAQNLEGIVLLADELTGWGWLNWKFWWWLSCHLIKSFCYKLSPFSMFAACWRCRPLRRVYLRKGTSQDFHIWKKIFLVMRLLCNDYTELVMMVIIIVIEVVAGYKAQEMISTTILNLLLEKVVRMC